MFFQARQGLIYNRQSFDPAAGGGGSATVTPTFGVNNGGGGTAPYTTGSITFTAGLAVIGVLASLGGGNVATTGVTVNTVGGACTQVGTAVTQAGDAHISLWQCTVSAGSGTVTVSNGTVFNAQVNVVGWVLGGLGSSTATGTVSANNFASPHADPQSMGSALTVNSGGVGISVIGSEFRSAAETGLSSTGPVWSPPYTRSATTETANATGNAYMFAGASTTTSGANTITVSGVSGSGWNFSGMMGAAWA